MRKWRFYIRRIPIREYEYRIKGMIVSESSIL